MSEAHLEHAHSLIVPGCILFHKGKPYFVVSAMEPFESAFDGVTYQDLRVLTENSLFDIKYVDIERVEHCWWPGKEKQ